MKSVGICLFLALVCVVVEGKSVFQVRDEEDLELLRKVINNANEDLVMRNIQEVSLPGSTHSYGLISGVTKNTRLGELSSLYVRGDDQFINRTDTDAKSTIYYDITIAMERFHLTYDFSYRILHFIEMSGNSVVSASHNKIRLTGKATTHPTGVCHVSLFSAAFTEIGGYEVSITPRSTLHSFIGYLVKTFNNYLFSTDKKALNEIISEKLKSDNFKATFSDIACHSFGF